MGNESPRLKHNDKDRYRLFFSNASLPGGVNLSIIPVG